MNQQIKIKMKRYVKIELRLFSWVVLLLAGTWAGCSKSDADDPGEPLNIELAAHEAEAVGGRVAVSLTISGFGRLNYLEVKRLAAGAPVTVAKLLSAELTPEYLYEYTLTADDPDEFELEFTAVATDGHSPAAERCTVRRATGDVTLALSQNQVRPDASGAFSVTVTVSDPEKATTLQIDADAIGLHRTVAAEELAGGYEFRHALSEKDADYFTVRFTVSDRNGVSDNRTLTVDRRRGLGFTGLKCVSRVTGAEVNGSNGLPAVEYQVNNRTPELYNVGGTDLGIVWELQPGRYGLFFGDTFGSDFYPNFANPGPNGGSWRSNVLLFSSDPDLSDGLTIDDAARDASGKYAREICYGGKDGSGNGDWTSIPTAAVRANGADYVHYMNIRNWAGWVTNYSSLYKSVDNGSTWERSRDVKFGSTSNFGQVGYARKDGYVYMVGTQTGRDHVPHVARFREQDIERQDAYEFWNGSAWIKGDEAAAKPLFNDQAGELSVAYHPKFGKWILLYFNGPRYEISFRSANEITGPWSEPEKLVDGWQYAQLYGSFIHPLSLQGDTLYFIMSMWLPYNTYLMSAELVRK